MRKVLLPVDGSDSAFQAALYLVEFVRQHGPVEVHVVNVQPKPVEWQTRGMEKDAINDHLAVAADLTMKPILQVLKEEKIPYQTQVKLGDPAEILAALAEELGCDHIVMGTRGLGGISGIVLGSVTRKVLHVAKVPVLCIKAPSSNR